MDPEGDVLGLADADPLGVDDGVPSEGDPDGLGLHLYASIS